MSEAAERITLDQINKWANEKGISDKPCPMCQRTEKIVMTYPDNDPHIEINASATILIPQTVVFPEFRLVCVNCTYQMSFSAKFVLQAMKGGK